MSDLFPKGGLFKGTRKSSIATWKLNKKKGVEMRITLYFLAFTMPI